MRAQRRPLQPRQALGTRGINGVDTAPCNRQHSLFLLELLLHRHAPAPAKILFVVSKHPKQYKMSVILHPYQPKAPNLNLNRFPALAPKNGKGSWPPPIESRYLPLFGMIGLQKSVYVRNEDVDLG
jgi:hypothetical protein